MRVLIRTFPSSARHQLERTESFSVIADRASELQSVAHEAILSTTGTQGAVASLAARVETLERTVRDLTLVMEERARAQHPRRIGI